MALKRKPRRKVRRHPPYRPLCADCQRFVIDPGKGCQACEGKNYKWPENAKRHCRVCGCHDDRACARGEGNRMEVCAWVELFLCSFCAERAEGGT